MTWLVTCGALCRRLLFLYACFQQRDRVEAFVSKVNGAMRVRHDFEKLKATADRIHNNYNVVEAVNEEMEKGTITLDHY